MSYPKRFTDLCAIAEEHEWFITITDKGPDLTLRAERADNLTAGVILAVTATFSMHPVTFRYKFVRGIADKASTTNTARQSRMDKVRDVEAVLASSTSPRHMRLTNEKIEEIEKVRARIAEKYAQEKHTPERDVIRASLISLIENANKIFGRFSLMENKSLETISDELKRNVAEAFVHEKLARLAQHVLDWEGKVQMNNDQTGAAMTLERAVSKLSNSALHRILRLVSTSSSDTGGLMDQLERAAELKSSTMFVEQFHPVHCSYRQMGEKVRELLGEQIVLEDMAPDPF